MIPTYINYIILIAAIISAFAATTALILQIRRGRRRVIINVDPLPYSFQGVEEVRITVINDGYRPFEVKFFGLRMQTKTIVIPCVNFPLAPLQSGTSYTFKVNMMKIKQQLNHDERREFERLYGKTIKNFWEKVKSVVIIDVYECEYEVKIPHSIWRSFKN